MRYQFIRFPGGKAKAVTFSYDDGCPEDIRFSDVITNYGIKCTFNLNGKILRGECITDEQIRKSFLERGHEVAVHGLLHRANGNLRAIEGIKDVLECRLELEERFGRIIRGMAYPDSGIRALANGASYEQIKNYLSDLGIVYARTLGGDNDLFELPSDWHNWMPSAHHNNPHIMEYIDKFLALDLLPNAYHARRNARLFYLWGHSYEFERNNNWELLDKICEKISGHEDVWYATNMEIYEYVTAYNSLIYSADGFTVYNPTLVEIYFDIDAVAYKILPGQTLNLK